MHIHIYQFTKLPKQVGAISNQTSQLNSHEKLIQNAYNYVLILKITKTNSYDHQTDITVEFTLQNSTEQGGSITKQTSQLNLH